MKAPTSLAALLTLLVVLASCAGTPPETAEGPDPAAGAYAAGLRLLEAASPESLPRAARLFLGDAAAAPGAGEQAALAAELYGLLYPQLGTGELPPGVGPYRGPYRGLLQRARAGEPPAGVVHSPEAEEGVQAWSAFLELVLPHVYLARLPADGPGGLAAPGRALEALARAESLTPGSVLPPYLSGRLREAAGELDQAADLYRESLRRAEGFYPGRMRLAALLLRQGRAAEAAELLQRVGSLLPDDTAVAGLLAQAYFDAGRLDEAATLAARALTQDPQDAQNLLLRARILYAQGAWAQALKPLGLLLYQHPDLAEAYLLGAEIQHQAARNPEGALELLAEAQRRFPQDPRFFEASGRILLDEARSTEGLKDLQRALDLEPGRVSTLRLLLADAVRMRRWLQAAIYLAEILEREESVQDLGQAWEIYSGLGDTAQALEYAGRLYRLHPGEANRVLYARALVQAGGTERNEEARLLVDEALATTRDPSLRSDLYVLKAQLAVAGGGAGPGEGPARPGEGGAGPGEGGAAAADEALGYLREALLADPDNLEAIRRIAAAYLDRRLLREASLYLKRAVQLDPENGALRVQLEQVEKSLQEAAAAGR